MGWTSPKTYVAGTVHTAADLNTYERDNFIAVRAGGVAMSSQADGDAVVATSAAQLGRVALGASQVLRRTAAGTGFEAYQPSLKQTFRGLVLRTHPDADKAAYQVYLDHADEIVMQDGTPVADWDDLVADVTASGAGGLDTGSEGSSRWYEVHAIRKSSDGTKNLLLHRAKTYDQDQAFTTATDATRNLRVATSAPQQSKLAQSFQPAIAGYVPFVDLQLVKNGSPTGRIWLTIEANSGGNPSGTPLATSDKLDVAQIAASNMWTRFNFRSPVSLSASTTYHLVLQGDYTNSDGTNVAWRGVAAGGYASGSAKYTTAAGGWTADTIGDYNFKTYVLQNDAAVTMPSGYNQRCLIGWVYNDGSSNFRSFLQKDREVSHNALNFGAFTSAFRVLTDLSSFLPPAPVVGRYMQTGTGPTDYCYMFSPEDYGWSLLSTTAAGQFMSMPFGGVLMQAVYVYVASGTNTLYVTGFLW